MRNEDCWNCSEVCTYEEISDAKGYDRVNVDTEKNAGDDDYCRAIAEWRAGDRGELE